MSIDINDYIVGALEGIIEQVDEVHRHSETLREAYCQDHRLFQEAMNKLEQLVRTVSDSVEIFQNYDGQYDRIARCCFGEHPGRYEVQCRLCEVQRLCSENTASGESRFSKLLSACGSKLFQGRAKRPKGVTS
jgi:hypothetical protein